MTQKIPNNLALIHERFEELVELYLELEKKPRKYGTDEYLTGSEIHLIELVGDFEDTLSVTDLAKYARVTKGAVSQNLKKLQAKGLIKKESDPQNQSRFIVQLTSKGKAAFYSHKHWHETMDGGYLKYMSALSEEKTEFIIEFLDIASTFLRSVIQSDD